ncbi:hypothetical protein LQG66_09390 [Bradyrhizobium ontarionense]|uniref:Uncharacterized protein n=1 Tax=Bradyrhizobium ontarionense TaxID=2898149 RepID=A0ABY3RGA4_9BRAD|nr:hypothetical protein [Bradyrhizobium sp. A19]UFZ06485.1 hypothetical protein LQG66_09390 [Bradyrhizobium sp. A19]
MTIVSRWILAATAAALTTIMASEPVLARGAAANLMNSPGYQRRLQESRQQLGAPELQPAPAPARARMKRHRHHHAH